MARLVVILAAFLTFTLPSLALAQTREFRAWFEAPQTVVAGETFQVWMWATYEEDGTPASDGWYSGVQASIEVSGTLAAFDTISNVRDGLPFRLPPGTPDGPWLRDFLVFQAPVPGSPFNDSVPLPVLMVEVTTRSSTTGWLHIDLRPASDQNLPWLSWWDDRTSDWINTLDSGVGLMTSTATIRVIPAPASAALLGLAVFSLSRRRR
ncbi:MAG: hypothetical protein KF757_02910 [Phycisphaeraceae bacterium]|nr:hypothetical protein [Phycisphaeraceae bacterium]